MAFVFLKSSDNMKFKVNVELAKCFGVTKNVLDLCNAAGSCGEENAIPLPNIEGMILKKVLDWARHYKNTMQVNAVLEQTPTDKHISKTTWETEFLTVNTTILFKLLMAAKYLDCPALINMTANELARLMQAKTPQEIRRDFNIKNDLTKWEEEENYL